VEFWGKKTLSDTNAGAVNLTPQPATIEQLRSLPAPRPLTEVRSAPYEYNTYTVSGVVTAIKAEADGDLHLVLTDPATRHTLIIESPDAAHCVRAAPALRQQMAAARAAIVAALGYPSSTSFQRVNRAVTVSGPAFFDKLHGQAGVAPNGVEIHSILQIAFQ
jgi:hypothetical protein